MEKASSARQVSSPLTLAGVMFREPSCKRRLPAAAWYSTAPLARFTVTRRREVTKATSASVDSIFHWAAGHVVLVTTKSWRLGRLEVGEYCARMMESEQTWIRNT